LGAPEIVRGVWKCNCKGKVCKYLLRTFLTKYKGFMRSATCVSIHAPLFDMPRCLPHQELQIQLCILNAGLRTLPDSKCQTNLFNSWFKIMETILHRKHMTPNAILDRILGQYHTCKICQMHADLAEHELISFTDNAHYHYECWKASRSGRYIHELPPGMAERHQIAVIENYGNDLLRANHNCA
jgi:hypothetical protein